MYREEVIQQFAEELASTAPMPGGGTVAALAGALGSALLSKVCRLTIGKERYRDAEAEMQSVLAQTEGLTGELLGLMDADADSFKAILAAYRLPRSTPEEAQARSAAIQEALKGATEVPLQMMERCLKVVELALPVAEKGNLDAVTDAAAGALMAVAALESAALNVRINLRSLKDVSYASSARDRMQSYIESAAAGRERVVKSVDDRLKS